MDDEAILLLNHGKLSLHILNLFFVLPNITPYWYKELLSLNAKFIGSKTYFFAVEDEQKIQGLIILQPYKS